MRVLQLGCANCGVFCVRYSDMGSPPVVLNSPDGVS